MPENDTGNGTGSGTGNGTGNGTVIGPIPKPTFAEYLKSYVLSKETLITAVVNVGTPLILGMNVVNSVILGTAVTAANIISMFVFEPPGTYHSGDTGMEFFIRPENLVVGGVGLLTAKYFLNASWKNSLILGGVALATNIAMMYFLTPPMGYAS